MKRDLFNISFNKNTLHNRARSLPQRDFLHYDADYYPLHSGSSLPRSSSRARARRPFSNLGDYGGYDQGINTYFGHDPYTER